MTQGRNTPRKLAAAIAATLLLGGCAYFNTFYNAQQYYKEGMRFKDQNQAGQAKGKFDKSIEKSALVLVRYPKSRWADDALLLIAMGYFQQGQYAKALRHFDQFMLAFSSSPLLPQAELHQGLAMLRNRDYGRGRVLLENLREARPKLADAATFYLAQSLVEREAHAEAVDSLAKFLARFPRSSQRKSATLLLAEECFRLERWAEAEEWYAKYSRLEVDPRKRFGANLKVATCRFRQGQFGRVADDVDDLLGRFGEFDDEVNLLLGKALFGLDRQQEGVAALSRVRSSTALGAEAAFLIGKLHEERELFDTARAYYDTARSRRAESEHGVLAVKRLSLLNALARRDSLGRDPAEAAFLLAEVHNLNLNDYDRAMELYQAVYDSFPETDWGAKALFAKAWILRIVRSDTVGSKPLLRRVIAEFPETEYADESRRWLGLPVPKRSPKLRPATDTLAASIDTLLPQPDESETASLEPSPDRPKRSGAEPETLVHVGPAGVSRPAPSPDATTVDMATGQAQMTAGSGTGTASTVDGAGPRADSDQSVQFPPLHFETDSWRIRAVDTAALRAIAARLVEMPGAVVLVGYCDPRGSKAHNDTLGLRRAEAVRNWLVVAGVPAERLQVESRGETALLSIEPADYWKDRRVEFEFR